MSRITVFFALSAAFLVATTARANTFTQCGCGTNFDCSAGSLTTWNAHSNLASVACAEECDAIKNDENQSACLSFSYDGSTTSQLEVEMAFAVLLSDNAYKTDYLCFASSSATTCDDWETELAEFNQWSEDFGIAVTAAAGMAVGVLIAIIVVPILLLALIIGLSIWCCCCKNNTNVVVVQGVASQPIAY
mmetsp:Transcript_38302/g.96259  ORF Transcript_38302/g.96259 Transcript_38302/m.96259 type:complete len:190 (-) Transcript_38302:130-699(-)